LAGRQKNTKVHEAGARVITQYSIINRKHTHETGKLETVKNNYFIYFIYC